MSVTQLTVFRHPLSDIDDERLHADTTTLRSLSRIQTITEKLQVYTRVNRPFGGPAPEDG